MVPRDAFLLIIAVISSFLIFLIFVIVFEYLKFAPHIILSLTAFTKDSIRLLIAVFARSSTIRNNHLEIFISTLRFCLAISVYTSEPDFLHFI